MKSVSFLLLILLLSLDLYSSPQFIEVEKIKGEPIRSRKVRIFGNKIISESKINEIIKNDGREISKGEMDLLLKRLEKFYISNGFELVEISYFFLMGEWYIFINEGRLGKIIIKGESALNTVLLKSIFVFRENTFNSIEMKNLVEGVKKNYGFQRIQYRFLPVERDKKSRFLLSEKVSNILNFESSYSYIEPSYDLLIIVRKKEWGDGVGGFLTYNSFGLVSGISYSDSSLITSGDRFKAVIKGGVNSRKDINTGDSDIIFTLIGLDLVYQPSILRLRRFKPELESLTSDVSYQRRDIYLNEYRLFSEDIALLAGYEIKKNLILSFGFGEEILYTHSFDYAGKETIDVGEENLFRSYLSLTLNYLIDEPSLRTDFRESLKSSVRYYMPLDRGSHWLFSSDYTKSKLFGFDYLKTFAGFKALSGDIPFFDEFLISYSSFKSSFSDRYYARDALYLGFEYALSIYRDIFHVAASADLTLFYYRDYQDGKMKYLGAIDGAPGIRLLIMDMFLLKIDYALALAFNGKRDNLLLFSVSKVF